MDRSSALLLIVMGVIHSAGCAAAPPARDYAADTAGIHRVYRETPAR